MHTRTLTQPGMKAVRQAAQLGTDSLGFLRERSDTYEMDTKVRNNCYVLFIMGMIIDHAYRCYPSLLRWEKKCTTIYFAQKWVQQCIYVIGGTKCVTGVRRTSPQTFCSRQPVR